MDLAMLLPRRPSRLASTGLLPGPLAIVCLIVSCEELGGGLEDEGSVDAAVATWMSRSDTFAPEETLRQGDCGLAFDGDAAAAVAVAGADAGAESGFCA